MYVEQNSQFGELIIMDKNLFLIEQYKQVRDRTNKHEAVEFQMLVLNITAFAAIFGLSNRIFPPFIPFALMAVLLICARTSQAAAFFGRWGTAYLINRYGDFYGGDSYESGQFKYFVSTASRTRIRRYIWRVVSPFPVLVFASFFGGIFLSFDFWIKIWNTGYWLLIPLSGVVIIGGHLVVVMLLISYGRKDLDSLYLWWNNYNGDYLSKSLEDYEQTKHESNTTKHKDEIPRQ